MCDPFSMIAAVGSIASAGINYMQQSSAMSAQESANSQWVAYQKQKSEAEQARQEVLRQNADKARQSALDQLTPDQQKQAQQTEQDRLTKDLTPADLAPGVDQAASDKLLSGQKNTSAPVAGDIAQRVTQAAQDARSRIAALAAVSSYGPSQFSIPNRANVIFQNTGNDIQLSGNERQGSLAAYGVEKQVEPGKVVATPSPWGALAGSLAGIAGKGAGQAAFS
jgi:hypothetical protein